jgi:DNA modification methylase
MAIPENEIILGDAYELIKALPDASVDCVYTDIPYQMHMGGQGFLKNRKFKEEIGGFVDGVRPEMWDEVDRVLRKKNLFVWCSKDQIPELLSRYVGKGWNFVILVWCKTNATPFASGTWLPDIEHCLHFYKGIKLNDGIKLKSRWYVSGTNVADKKQFQHPTIKPLNLVERHLLHATQPGDLVLDPFCGSGTTCLAAKETDRRYLGFEIDPEFHRIATDRLNGIDASGQTSIFTDFDKEPKQLTIFDMTGGTNDE